MTIREGSPPFARTIRTECPIRKTLPQEFRTEAIDDRNSDTVALMRGPVQYVALASESLRLPANLKQTRPQRFVEDYAGRQVEFVPLHQVQEAAYTSYFSRA